MLAFTLGLNMIRMPTRYLAIELSEIDGFLFMEERTGPYPDLRGIPSKDWSANSGDLAEEDEAASYVFLPKLILFYLM